MQRALIAAAVLFTLIVGGMFAFAYWQRSAVVETHPELSVTPEEPQAARRIDAKHFYRGATHTIAGEVLMPTPCDLLETDVVVRESFPEQVTVAFTVINHAEACAQVITPQRFRVDFDASERAVIGATWEGKPAILNLIEAGPGESPADFELFIKG